MVAPILFSHGFCFFPPAFSRKIMRGEHCIFLRARVLFGRVFLRLFCGSLRRRVYIKSFLGNHFMVEPFAKVAITKLLKIK